jgi:hypothetical protein
MPNILGFSGDAPIQAAKNGLPDLAGGAERKIRTKDGGHGSRNFPPQPTRMTGCAGQRFPLGGHMVEVSTFRLYLLRATYLLLVVALGADIWPLLLHATHGVEHMRGVVWSLLAAVSLLAVVGVRYPLRMLPLLLFELVWKSIWVLAIGLPLWSANQLTPATRDTWNACLMGLVIFPAVIPWRYVLTHFITQPGDRWRTRPKSATTAAAPRPTRASAS